MALPKKTKDPDEVLDYLVDWTARLDGDTISSHTAFTADENGTAATVDLEVDSSTNDDNSVTVWVSGGELGAEYYVCTRIVTAAARTMDQTFRVQMTVK